MSEQNGARHTHFLDNYISRQENAERMSKTAGKGARAMKCKECDKEIKKGEKHDHKKATFSGLPWEVSAVQPPSDFGSVQSRMFTALNKKLKELRVAGHKVEEESYRISQTEKMPNGAELARLAKAIYKITLPTVHPQYTRQIRLAVFYDSHKRKAVEIDQQVVDEKDKVYPLTGQTIDKLAAEVPHQDNAKGQLVFIDENGMYQELGSKNPAEAAKALAANGIKVSAHWVDRVYGPQFGAQCRLIQASGPAQLEQARQIIAQFDETETEYDDRAEEDKSFGYDQKPYDDRAEEKSDASDRMQDKDYDHREEQKLEESAYNNAYGSEDAMLKYDSLKPGRGAPRDERKAQTIDAPSAADSEPYEGVGETPTSYDYPDAESRKPSTEQAPMDAGSESDPAGDEGYTRIEDDDPYAGEGRDPNGGFEFPEDADEASTLADTVDEPQDDAGPAGDEQAKADDEDPYAGIGEHPTDVEYPESAADDGTDEAADMQTEASKRAQKARDKKYSQWLRQLRAANAARVAQQGAKRKVARRPVKRAVARRR